MKNRLGSEILKLAGILLFLAPFYLLLYKVYIPHVNSFGCFDECLNIGAGYFMQFGKDLYSQIFFNHQPNAAYLSFFVQIISNPSNLYELLLRHIQFVLLWSFFFNLIIIKRFKIAGIGFVIIYELSKYYFFGYRFLAESFIVYPMVYMIGLIIYKFQNKKIYNIEYLLSAIFSWFVIFSREPYAPVALLQFILILGSPNGFYKKLSIFILVFLSALSILILPVKEYVYSIAGLNYEIFLKKGVSDSPLSVFGILKSFLYPEITLFSGQWNELRIILIGLSIPFITAAIHLALRKKIKLVIIVLLVLGLSNLRSTDVATVYYQAFRMIPWFGMFVLATFLLIKSIKKNKLFTYILYFSIIISFILFLLHPEAYFKNSPNPHVEFLNNYGDTFRIGQTVGILSEPNQTFFININDNLNLSYWQSGLDSPYKYSWFGYIQPGIKEHQSARDEMFLSYPPDFYQGDLNMIADTKKQREISNKYFQIYKDTPTSGLHIKKSLIKQIPKEKWIKAKEFRVIIPEEVK